MSVPQKIWFHFIVDTLNRCLYVEDGVIKRSSPPYSLPQLARGWMEMQISFYEQLVSVCAHVCHLDCHRVLGLARVILG